MTKFLNNADVKGYVAQTAVTSSLLKTDADGKLVAAVAGTDYNAPGVTASAGTLVREIRNTTGATLTKGTIVYISGATGNKPTVSKALATGDSTSAQTFGLCQTNIANNSNGNVVCAGDITGLDTSALTEGAQLYLSSTTAGTYTTTKQLAPAHLVYIGVVTRSHPTQGQIEVKIQNGYELDEIHDVSISSLANNHTLVWESATSLWKNKTIATALGFTPADNSAVVKLTGDQTVAGVKTFTSVVNAPTLSLNGGVLAGNNIVSMRSNPTGGQFRIEKSDGSLSAYPFYIGADGTALAYYYNAAGALKVLLHTDGTSYFGNNLSVGYTTYGATTYKLDVNGTARVVGPVLANAPSEGATGEGLIAGQSFKIDATATGQRAAMYIVSNVLSDTYASGLQAQYANFAGDKGFGFNLNTAGGFELYVKNTSWNKALTIANTKAATFTDTVTATSFIKTGGTSVQFLKADGSLDSSTYLTSSSLSGYLPLTGGTLTGALSGTSATFSSSVTATSATLSQNSNSVVDILTLYNVSATSAGVRQRFQNGFGDLAAIKVSQRDNGALADDGQIEFQVASNSVLDTKLTILNTGQLKLNTYTASSSFSGTAAGYLAFDSSGNVITLASVAATDSTKLPLAGGTMTGIIAFSNVTGNKIDFYYSGEDRYGIQVQSDVLRIHSGAQGIASGGIVFGKSTSTTFTEAMRIRNDGIVQITGYLRTAGITSNTVFWSAGAANADFGNVFGQGTSSRSTLFRGNGTSTSVWWGGTDGLGNVIPFTAIDATSGEFSFWRNSGGVGGGSWTQIMTMNASGLTINSGNFVGNLTGNITGSAATATTATTTTGNAGSVTYLPNRADSAAYPVLWGASYTNTIGTIAYSCASVTIQSSTGTLSATNLYATSLVTARTNGDYRQATLGAITGAALFITSASSANSYGLLVGSSYTYGDVWLQASRTDGATSAYNISLNASGGTVTVGTLTAQSGYILTVNGAVTTGLLVAQGPGGNYNENIRLPGSTSVISFNTSGTTGAGSYNIVSQTSFQIRNAGGTQVFVMDQSGNLTMTGTVTAPTFSGALSGNATSASSATTATNVASPDGDRNPSTKLPTTNPRNVRFDFATSASIGGTGNYGGVMTYTPWDGTSASTGDSSYQLAFLNETGLNASGVPGLSLRNGINSTWNAWYRIITSGNIASQTVGNTTSISSATGNNYNWTGLNYFVSNRNTSTDSAPLQAYSNNGSGAIMSFHRGGYYAINMGLDSDNVFRIGGWSALPNRLQLDMGGNLTVAATVNAPSGYVSSPNPWSTADSAFFPNGITTAGGTNWIYGSMTYIGNAPSNGAGHHFTSGGDSRHTGTIMPNYIGRPSHSTGFLVGSYNNIGGNSGNTNPIYTIGSSYTPNDTSLINMYGIGYAHPNLWGAGKTSSWGLYVCEAATINATIGGGAVTIWAQNDIVAYSDIRVKDNIEVIPNAVSKIQALRGVTFTRIDAKDEDKDKRHAGVIAQEVLAVHPEVVSGTEKDMYSVAYGNMAGLFIEAFKEQQLQIEELKSIINDLAK